MIQYHCFINFAKEEAWLREMARQGWELTRVDLGYHFRKAEAQDALIRIDFRVFASQDEYLNYITLFEDSGWKHIFGSLHGAQYFQRTAAGDALSDSADDIFSGAYSRAERFRRYALLWGVLAGVSLMLLAVLGATGTADLSALVQPGRFYLTPGLWERTGDAFWRAFWFETPFALFRALLLWSFPVLMVLYLTFALKSNNLYQQERSDVNQA